MVARRSPLHPSPATAKGCQGSSTTAEGRNTFNNPTMTPTLHTLTTLLNPWRTIRRLEAEKQLLSNALADRKFVGVALHQLKMREMAEQSNRELRAELETSREALWRLQRWGGWPLSPVSSWDVDTTVAVADWLQSGMTGPLPPLPEYLAKREQADAGEAA